MPGLNHGPYTECYEVIRGFLQFFLTCIGTVGITGLLSLPSPCRYSIVIAHIRPYRAVAYPEILFGGVQQIQLRTEDRENRDLEAVAP